MHGWYSPGSSICNFHSSFSSIKPTQVHNTPIFKEYEFPETDVWATRFFCPQGHYISEIWYYFGSPDYTKTPEWAAKRAAGVAPNGPQPDMAPPGMLTPEKAPPNPAHPGIIPAAAQGKYCINVFLNNQTDNPIYSLWVYLLQKNIHIALFRHEFSLSLVAKSCSDQW